jgi:hypothetical protein
MAGSAHSGRCGHNLPACRLRAGRSIPFKASFHQAGSSGPLARRSARRIAKYSTHITDERHGPRPQLRERCPVFQVRLTERREIFKSKLFFLRYYAEGPRPTNGMIKMSKVINTFGTKPAGNVIRQTPRWRKGGIISCCNKMQRPGSSELSRG